ncbi:uncharacterized protein EAF02_002493 [Botrytis sinoallii]|uniref:uncharacterized protein n=1 Tax=Botrytis sinoallii TaxID=1463999 RepID=UPI001901E630|nr:uncharacterized protein EAF02_002493 [Botrytis sinoallii]KAF7890078.1 hypothetical protein EAF02_002493 [Botrytis sinoallii]
MVQYLHVRGGLKPKTRVVISKALARLSPRSIRERGNYKRFVAEPVDSESICFTNLPYEIRLMIWHECFESRVVTICAHRICSWTDGSREYKPAVSSVRATMPLTLRINRESRFETLRHYPDLIQNPGLFRDPVYFNPRLDKLAIHVLDKDRHPACLPQLFHRDRKSRIMADQCLCLTIQALAEISIYSPSMCKMIQMLWESIPSLSQNNGQIYQLKTIVVQSPDFNETMIINNISKDCSWAMRKRVWKAIKSRENFEDNNWRITKTDDHNLPLL